MSPVLPPAGAVLAVVPSVATSAEALLAGWQAADALRRLVRVPARPEGTGDVVLAGQLGGSSRDRRGDAEWIRLTPELRTLLQRPWRELGAAERYLAGVARALVGRHDVIVLEQPGASLGFARLRTLVADLAAGGWAVVWLERRLRLLAAAPGEVWLVDRERWLGPLDGGGLVDHPLAWTLCFGGTLEAAGPPPQDEVAVAPAHADTP
jgi:hypothetical protein